MWQTGPTFHDPHDGMMTRTRFAPSPNGELHVGHAFSALFSERFARERGGRFLLRIEDIDVTRTRERYVEGILEDLRWLGLEWEKPVRRQSRHMDDYSAITERLKEEGLLYPCFCTRRQISACLKGRDDWPRDPDGRPLYPGTCRHLGAEERAARIAAGEEHALRLDMEEALRRLERPLAWHEEGGGPDGERGRIMADPARWGDVILVRKDIGTSYHVAVVADDALQGITHVTRGRDLFHATAVHRLLQTLLGLPEPVYVHHPLITDDSGRKLSKRFRDRSLRSLREGGADPAELRRALGFPG